MSGRRPDTTLTYNFKDSFRGAPAERNGGHAGTSWQSYPEYFKQHGYNTTGCGKTYHAGHPGNFDQPYSWTEGIYGRRGDTLLIAFLCHRKQSSAKTGGLGQTERNLIVRGGFNLNHRCRVRWLQPRLRLLRQARGVCHQHHEALHGRRPRRTGDRAPAEPQVTRHHPLVCRCGIHPPSCRLVRSSAVLGSLH